MRAKYIRLIFGCSILMILPSVLTGTPLTDPFPSLRDGMGYASGMGGTGVAQSDGPDAVFWNPAGYNGISIDGGHNLALSYRLAGTVSSLPTPMAFTVTYGRRAPLFKQLAVFTEPAISGSVFAYQIASIPSFGVDGATGAPIELNKQQELMDVAAVLTFGSPIIFTGNRWTLGVNGILFQRRLTGSNTGFAYAKDFGTKLKLLTGNEATNISPPVTLGARLRSLPDVKWEQSGGGIESTDESWRYVDYGLLIGNSEYRSDLKSIWWKYFALAGQVRIEENKDWAVGVGAAWFWNGGSARLGAGNILTSQGELPENATLTCGLGWKSELLSFDFTGRYYLNAIWRNFDGQLTVGTRF